MTSAPFLVVCIDMAGNFWGYTVITGIPQYFLAVPHVSLEKVFTAIKGKIEAGLTNCSFSHGFEKLLMTFANL